MKKTFKNWLLPVAVAVSAVLYWHCEQVPAQSPADQTRAAPAPAPPTQYNIAIASVQNSNGFGLSFVNPPTPNGTDGDWRVFVNFGDGTFWMGSKSAFDTKTFTYEAVHPNNTNGYKIYAELTPTYDDKDKNPGRSAIITQPVILTSSDHQRDVIMGVNKYVKLQSNRSPLRGDSITYIITYQHQRSCDRPTNGDLIFHYDPDVLELEIPGTNSSSIDGYNGETEYAPGTAPGQIHLKFTGLQKDKQRNIFLRMVTKTVFTSTHAYVTPWVAYSDTLKEDPALGCGSIIMQDTSNMQYQSVVTSHDPNHKFGVEESIAPSPNTDSVTFTVMFQNEGPHFTQNVVVYDELDALLVRDTPRLVSWSTPKRPKPTIDNRTVKFDFGPLQVRGLGEDEYGIKFGEDSTMEVFTFRCAVRKQSPLNTDPDPNVVEKRPCNAICNQAWVVFDCNPRYPTNVAKVPIRCSSPGPSPSPAPTAFIAPSLCQEFRDTLNFDSLSTDSFLLSTTQLAQLSATLQGNINYKHKWYPSENLHNPFALNPVVRDPSASKPPPHQYVLVSSAPSSSQQCERRIVYVNLPSPCSLAIVIKPIFSGGGGCTSSQITSLEASVTGLDSGSDPNKLEWHQCSSIGPTFTTSINQNQDEYYFGVTDPATGCSAEVLYKLSSTSGGGSGGGSGLWGSVLVASLLIAISALLYAIFKKK